MTLARIAHRLGLIDAQDQPVSELLTDAELAWSVQLAWLRATHGCPRCGRLPHERGTHLCGPQTPRAA